MAKKEKLMESLYNKVNASSEEEFLKYQIDCCENILENEKMMEEILVNMDIGHPIVMQLIKLRAEISQRLEVVHNVKYGKFANGEALLAKLAKASMEMRK